MLSWFSAVYQSKWRVSTSGGPSRLLPIHHSRSPHCILRLRLLYSWNSIVEQANNHDRFKPCCPAIDATRTGRGSSKTDRYVDKKELLEPRFYTSGAQNFSRLAEDCVWSQTCPYGTGMGLLSEYDSFLLSVSPAQLNRMNWQRCWITQRKFSRLARFSRYYRLQLYICFAWNLRFLLDVAIIRACRQFFFPQQE
jgi:hypothetical protein